LGILVCGAAEDYREENHTSKPTQKGNLKFKRIVGSQELLEEVMIYLQACRHRERGREREREITTAHECRDLTHAKVKKFNNTNT